MMHGALTAVPPLPPPPAGLGRGAFLFLDFDGTLVPIAGRPDGVVVTPRVTAVLGALARARPGRVAILSGRSLAQLDALLGPCMNQVAAAGSHGAERRVPGQAASVSPPSGLDAAAVEARRFADTRPGVVVEVKTLGVALHYRGAPAEAGAAHALAGRLARAYGLVLQSGKMVAEVRAPGSKGAALAAMLPPGTAAVMIGDDVTDEDAFAAAAASGGAGILVGDPRLTAAAWGLAHPDAVLDWLEEQAA